MFYEIFKFELRNRMKKISTYVYFGILFVLSFIITLSMGGIFKSFRASVADGGQGAIFANAPYIIHMLISNISFLGLMIVAGMMGNAAYRDFEQRTYTLYFSYPIRKYSYIGGRFLGNIIVLLFIYSSLAFGVILGSLMPFVQAEKFGSFRLMAYIGPYLIAILPNLIFTGSIFYSLALIFRKRTPVYMSAVGLLVGYLLAGNLISDMTNGFIASLLDPLGNAPLLKMTRYWTPAQKNTLLVPFSGEMLLNRVLWISVGFIILWFGTRKFKLSYFSSEKKMKNIPVVPEEINSTVVSSFNFLSVQPVFSINLYLKQFFKLVKTEFFSIVKNVYFIVIVFLGVVFTFIVGLQNLGKISGTSVYPVTYSVLEISSASFMLFIVIILTFYAGEVVWRDRDKRFSQIFDTLPVPDGIIFTSRLFSLLLVQVLMCFILMICGILIQISLGYYNFEIQLYIKELFGIRLSEYLIYTVLAYFVHVIVNNKYTGHFIMILYYIGVDFLPAFGLQNKLYIFPESTSYIYSDMNGYGHFLGPLFLFRLYWAAFAILLAVLAYLFRIRGIDTHFALRIKKAKLSFTPIPRFVSLFALIIFLTSGGIIFYNTSILNPFKTTIVEEKEKVSYEKKYKQYEHLPQPRIIDVKTDVEIYPYQRKATLVGSYLLKNKNKVPVTTIHVLLPPEMKINTITFDKPNHLDLQDKKLGYFIYSLKEPLSPGQQMSMQFDVTYEARGFKNDQLDTYVVYNGTFFNSMLSMPRLGYSADGELSDDDVRKKYNLKPKPRMAPVDDLQARMNTYISSDSDWINFEATIGTVAHQIALAPGTLIKEWKQGNRRYFHYKMNTRTLNFYSFISAQYQIKRDHWKDIDIEIYYHKTHYYNVDRMILAVKKSLEYYTSNFGPYQHKLVRIVEFPRFARFAQSFPTTIPYSEGIGFIARVEKDDVDYPFEVTAHEVAHQWWAHQVIGGNVQGATLMSEVLSQYSALMVMKNNFDDKLIRKALKYDLDKYFVGRGRERKKEVPLKLIENQGYLHYDKGIIVMNALQDYIGEENLNKALARYIKDVAYQEPPYTNSIQFLSYIREATPPHLQYIITDLFETITLYENKCISASYVKRQDGKYEVTLRVQSRKFRDDGKGNEKEIPVRDWMDIGILDKNEDPLYLQKFLIDKNEKTFTIIVDKPPFKAGIDPYVKLIDRFSEDNVIEAKKN